MFIIHVKIKATECSIGYLNTLWKSSRNFYCTHVVKTDGKTGAHTSDT